MLVMMKRQLFDSIDNAGLAEACIGPTIQLIRGKDLTVKAQVYAQLTIGQRALLMFWVLNGHAYSGMTRFYCEVDYLLSQKEFWSELRSGMRFFRDDTMLGLLDEMESVYHVLVSRISRKSTTRRNVTAEDIGNDPELRSSVYRLDAIYREIAPATLNRVCAYIRSNPGAFVTLENN